MGEPIDIAQFLDRPAAIVGTTGAGKTFAAKGAVEHLLRLGRRVVIIDPTGAWWGLRAGADGSEAGGFPVVIFGGEHADVPVTPDGESGKALALAIAERDVQAIIDTSEMTGGEKNRFLTPFLENLYARNKAALHLIVDEADEVAAQRLADGEQRLFGAFDKIVRRGRLKGFRPLMISQRPAVIHKNVLSQIGTLIALKLTSPQDRKAIEEWVKGNADADQAKAVMQSLPTLQRGEGWVWAPADGVLERTTFPAIATFDSSRTPDHDEAVVAPALTAVDVAALRAELVVKPAEGTFEASVKGAETSVASVVDLRAAEQRGYERGFRAGREEGYREGKHDGGRQMAHAQLVSAVDGLAGAAMLNGDGEVLQEALTRLRASKINAEPFAATTPSEAQLRKRCVGAVRAEVPAEQAVADNIPAGEDDAPSASAMEMLDTLVVCHPWPISARLWGAFSNRSPISGPWHKAVKNLRAHGLIEAKGGQFVATTVGLTASEAKPVSIGSDVALWRHWRETISAVLGTIAVEMLQALSAHLPNGLTARQWGLIAGRSPISGLWHAAVKSLLKWECIEKTGSVYRATEQGVQIAGNEGGEDTAALLTALRIGRLSPVARSIYDALPGKRADLADRLGKSPISGPWHSAIKELLASGLATEQGKTIVRIEEQVSRAA